MRWEGGGGGGGGGEGRRKGKGVVCGKGGFVLKALPVLIFNHTGLEVHPV